MKVSKDKSAWEKMYYRCARKYTRTIERAAVITGWTLLGAAIVGLITLMVIQFTIPSFVVDNHRLADAYYDQGGVQLREQAQSQMDTASLWVGRCILWPVNLVVVLASMASAVVAVFGLLYLIYLAFTIGPISLCVWWHLRKQDRKRT